MTTKAIFPNGILGWTNRVDQADVVWANDPNSLAGEIAAVESTLGVNPQVEKFPLSGNPVDYGTVDARISAMIGNKYLPIVSLGQDSLQVQNTLFYDASTNFGLWNTYTPAYDPYGLYNGNSVTVPSKGWYFINIGQYWDWWSVGYHRISFWVDNFWYRHNIWHWDFDGNDHDGWWQCGQGLQRETHTSIEWQGVLQAGQRIRVLSENGTPHTPHRTFNLDFQMSMLRAID